MNSNTDDKQNEVLNLLLQEPPHIPIYYLERKKKYYENKWYDLKFDDESSVINDDISRDDNSIKVSSF